MKNKRSAVLSIALFCFLLGLGFARFKIPLHPSLCYGLIAATLFGLLLIKRTKTILMLCIILTGFLAGWWRGAMFMKQVAVYSEVIHSRVVIEATAEEDAIYNEKKQLTFNVNNILLTEPLNTKLVGSIKVEGFGVPMVYRGDRVVVVGKLFPRRGGQQASMSFAHITLISHNNSLVDKLRRRFVVAMHNVLPEPTASFALGLLIGQRSTLPETTTEQLIDVGLIHIVAVSGYNLTIIINACHSVLQKRSRYQALVLSLGLIMLFLLFTGYSPSIVRAALVSGLSLILWFLGRSIKPVLLILLIAVITAGANPLYVWSNIGWYLSFAAFFGVLIIAPQILLRFKSKKLRESLLMQVLVETTAAQLCTIPLILFVFGRLSVISILANILVVPFVPFAMLLSLLAGIFSIVHSLFTGIIAWPARVVLNYMLSVAELLSHIPLANVNYRISWQQMLYLYVLIGFVTCILWLKKNKTIKKHKELHGWTQ